MLREVGCWSMCRLVHRFGKVRNKIYGHDLEDFLFELRFFSMVVRLNGDSRYKPTRIRSSTIS